MKTSQKVIDRPRLREEPDYADACWAATANVYLGEALFGFNQTSSLAILTEKFVGAAQKAVALEPRNVMANYILAMTLFYSKDKARFLAIAEYALKLAPSRPDNLAVIYGYLDNKQEEHKALGRMFDLRPDAYYKLKEILNFWFPFEDLAEVFSGGLRKAGFSIEN